MMDVRVESVLLDIDGPQIMLLRDNVGTAYVGLMTERIDDRDVFLCTPISVARLVRLRMGSEDLLAIFASPEISSFYSGRIELPLKTPPSMALQALAEIPHSWLPDEGFLLSDFLAEVSADEINIVSQALERHRPVVHLNLDPPEAIHASRINADRLAHGIAVFQNLVKHAHKRALTTLTEAKRKLLGSPDNYTMEVFAFAPGSFEVHLQAKTGGDLLGHNSLSMALAKVDELASSVTDPDASVAIAQENRGHFVSAYQTFLQFVAESETPVRYSWAEPLDSEVHSCRISPEAASVLYEKLTATKELGYEEFSAIGRFSKADKNTGSWALTRADGKVYRGWLSPEHDVTLVGVEIQTKVYTVQCREVLNETVGSGRQETRILMLARDDGIT
jgi:hypothetical protein